MSMTKQMEAETVGLPHGDHESDVVIGEKEGTTNDVLDMQRLGKTQVMRRNFGFFSIFGFALILMSTWEVTLAAGTFSLLNGGTGGGIVMYLIGWAGFFVTTLSMAEMGSMAPTAGGQYHWVSEFAPASSQAFISYIIGWLCVLGWQTGVASGSFLAGTEIQGLIILNNPNYEPQRWHGTLLMIAILGFCVLFNTVLAKRLPLVEGCVLILHILGFFAILIPLWVLAPRSSAKEVFTSFQDNAGWGNIGLSCLVGLLAPVLSLLGSDAATHMSEELRNASKTLPRAMVSTLVLNGALGFIMLITFFFCVGDVESVLATPTGYPFIQVFYNATQSKAGTTVMTSILIILATFNAITNMATASRQLFSFARDNGVPFKTFFEAVPPGWDIPLNAIGTTVFISCLFSLVQIGSTIAFNQINSLGLCALLNSYMVSIACIALKRARGEPLLNAHFKLGKWGLPINIASIMFLAISWVMIFFPPAPNPNAQSMNWSAVVYVGVCGGALIYYFLSARHKYDGPVTYVRKSE